MPPAHGKKMEYQTKMRMKAKVNKLLEHPIVQKASKERERIIQKKYQLKLETAMPTAKSKKSRERLHS